MEKVDGRYSVEFRRYAVERMRDCKNITTLARELGISRPRLYFWKKNLEHPDVKSPEKRKLRDPKRLNLEQQLQVTQRLLAQKTVELDFVKGALRRTEARRQRSAGSGETTSTGKSER